MSDHEWDQMSVMERCEVLRAQVRRLMQRNGQAQLEDIAVKDLESMNKNNGAGWGAEWCDSRELARLRRIEEAAARTLVHIDMSPATLAVGPAVRDLRAALDSEPKR